MIKIKSSKIHGIGVFSTIKIYPGKIIESCPIIKISNSNLQYINKTELCNYYYDWGDNKNSVIALGFGSLYNHSYTPNAEYMFDYNNNRLIVIAIRIIQRNSEITINYNGDPNDKTPVWFEK